MHSVFKFLIFNVDTKLTIIWPLLNLQIFNSLVATFGNKPTKMIDDSSMGFCHNDDDTINIDHELQNPSNNRIQVIAKAFDEGYSIERVFELTKIDRWFLHKLYNIHNYKSIVQKEYSNDENNVLLKAKQLGFSDKFIGYLTNSSEREITSQTIGNHLFNNIG